MTRWWKLIRGEQGGISAGSAHGGCSSSTGVARDMVAACNRITCHVTSYVLNLQGDVIGNNATSQFTQWSNGSTPEWPPPCNRVDEIAIISGKLRRLYDIEGINALSGINLCADTSCSIIPGQDIVTTTYSGFTSHALDKDYFNLITNRKVNVQVTVKYTPNWYQASSANGSFLYRRSNLRLLLGVDNPNILIQKAGGFDGVMTTETTYTLIPPLSGEAALFTAIEIKFSFEP
jgi:hypothetical protein